jgi:hypothetical protein
MENLTSRDAVVRGNFHLEYILVQNVASRNIYDKSYLA